jgi:hypothetical protein
VEYIILYYLDYTVNNVLKRMKIKWAVDHIHSAAAAKEFARAARAWGAEATKTKESARKTLRDLGIITPTGRLKKNYR